MNITLDSKSDIDRDLLLTVDKSFQISEPQSSHISKMGIMMSVLPTSHNMMVMRVK